MQQWRFGEHKIGGCGRSDCHLAEYRIEIVCIGVTTDGGVCKDTYPGNRRYMGEYE